MSLKAIMGGSRIGRAVGLAVLLGIFLIWWNVAGNPGSPVGTREIGGVITEVHEKAYVVRLDSGQHVRVFRTVKAEVGSRVQLSGTKYASGEESFVLPETGVLSE